MLTKDVKKLRVVVNVKQLDAKLCCICLFKNRTTWDRPCTDCSYRRCKTTTLQYKILNYKNKFKVDPKYLYDNIIQNDLVELEAEIVDLKNWKRNSIKVN